MALDVGKFYLSHLHATAGAPHLFLRALERAQVDLDNGDVDGFCLRVSRLRRSLRFEVQAPEVSVILVKALLGAMRSARQGDEQTAKAHLQPLIEACASARPASSIPGLEPLF